MASGKSKEELAKISKATQFKTGSEQVEIARLGGFASGEAKRKRKTIREELEFLLAQQLKNKKGKYISTREAISTAMIGQAIKGNVKAFIAIRDTIGENPTDKHEVTGAFNIMPSVEVNGKELNFEIGEKAK